MSPEAVTTCPRCGHAASGNFCATCGAGLTAGRCASCGATLTPGAAFCHGCGAPASGAAPLASAPTRNTAAWVVAGLLVVISIGAVVYSAGSRNAPAPASMANAGNADPGAAPRAPDISKLSLKEQFARLNDKVMEAAEKGDTTTVFTFWPMTLGAYQNLTPADRDIDARYHMATLYLMITQYPQTLALADTILAESKDNLFGYYLRSMVAEYQGDSVKTRAARADFVRHYPAEIRKQQTEYLDHRPVLDKFFRDGGGK